MLVPLFIGGGMLQITAKFFPSSPLLVWLLTIGAFAISLPCCVRWCQRRLQRRADDYLGFFGERYVAESLEPLKAGGWFVFHDVPCMGATGRFNLDHVAVGPGGIWVIETKTRRKGQARPGLKKQDVVFDGNQLIWPRGEDTDSLKQASNGARWLREWIEKMTGRVFDVAAVLAVPGYFVTEKKLGPVRVANPKMLLQILTSRRTDVLGRENIDLVRRQLEARCRNVEY
jgi:hypothetical protein